MSDTIEVRAGAHGRLGAPVRVTWSGRRAPGALACGQGVVPAQLDGDALVFVPLPMVAGASATYRPVEALTDAGVTVQQIGGSLAICVDGQEFTRYRYQDVAARPYFWPIIAPNGARVTRSWPIADDVPGERRDHQHHRSLYFAYGDVNGVDNWSEEEGHGFTAHRSLDGVVSGPVFGRFSANANWCGASGEPVLEERATVTVYNTGARFRLMDIDLRLTASFGAVRFGDTKEGGMVSVRVATEMDVPRTGTITNAYGGVNEAETWGKRAHWCDYSGTVGGVGAGICVMDHPDSFRHPTHWHVRDYGLMTANPFALNDYTHGAMDGSYDLPAGAALRFVYRILVHDGSADDAGIRERYLDFVAPSVTVVHSEATD